MVDSQGRHFGYSLENDLKRAIGKLLLRKVDGLNLIAAIIEGE